MSSSSPLREVRCQRWRDRKDLYRGIGDTFDPSIYSVDVLSERDARVFVQAHHYSASMPAARLSIGLFGPQAVLCGVAVFSVPCNQSVVPKYAGCAPDQGVELGRFVLLDAVPGNGESFFGARALRLAAQELDVQAVVSYADPVARVRSDGAVVMPGHVGIIYRALNARHVGRSRARKLVLAPDGRVVSERTLSKLRNGERGADAAYRLLLGYGAPERAFGEAPDEYVQRALQCGTFRSIQHPGNYAYVLAVGDRRRRRAARATFAPGLPYPVAA